MDAGTPSASPLALLLSRSDFELGPGSEDRAKRARDAAWEELGRACARGEARAREWMPAAIACELSGRAGDLPELEVLVGIQDHGLHECLGLLTTRFPNGFDGQAPFRP